MPRLPLLSRSPFALLFAVALAGGFAPAAHATPTGDPLPGPTGLGVIPTTQTVAPGAFEASLGYEYVSIRDGGGHADQQPFANLSYGFHDGEVGASYLRQKTATQGFSATDNYYTLHGKYRVYTTVDGLGSIAVGAHYYDFGRDSGVSLGNVLSLYATGSYDIENDEGRTLGRLHLGVLGQRSHAPGKNTTFARPFVGAEAQLTPDISIGADFLARNGDAAKAYTLSARYVPEGKSLSAQIGIGKLRNDTKYFVGLTYAFGGK